MSKEYNEYRRHRSRQQNLRQKKNFFSGKVTRQLVLSLTLFGTIYGFRLFGPDSINTYIRNAFFYEIDTTVISDTVTEIFRKTKETFRKDDFQNDITPEATLFKEL